MRRLLAVLTAATTLGACASFSPDGAYSAVEKTTRERLGMELRWARSAADQDGIDTRVAELLAQPLTADHAVQVALLNNRGLQAAFQELGIAEAERVQGHRLEQTQGQVALSVLALAAETRKAQINALAAAETVRYLHQVRQVAEASAELARRMEQVGNFNKLQRAREQGFYADAALGLARAEQAQRRARERLARLLGVWGTQVQFALPDRLPDLPKAARDLPDIERIALARRLDVQGARLAAGQMAEDLGLARSAPFANVLELGLQRNPPIEAPTRRGPQIGLELPFFDWGEARVARAEAVYMQTLHRAAETAINARSEVREAYSGYRSAYDIARHHFDEIVPLRKTIAEENVLRYNGMLIGVFDLLADARAQIASVNAAIEALRDFWLAEADLEMALIGKPNLPGMAGAAAAGPAMPAEAAGH